MKSGLAVCKFLRGVKGKAVETKGRDTNRSSIVTATSKAIETIFLRGTLMVVRVLAANRAVMKTKGMMKREGPCSELRNGRFLRSCHMGIGELFPRLSRKKNNASNSRFQFLL